MWIKRNDHALKNECVDFFYICPKRVVLECVCIYIIKFDRFLVFIFSSSKNISLKFYGPLPFSTRAILLLLPRVNPLDRVSG